MFGKYCEDLIKKPLTSLAKRIYISPNALTVTGFILTLFASLIIPHNLLLGGVLILLSGFFDMIDGEVARVHDKYTDFGAFLDSVLDRYSDAFLFLGFTWYFFNSMSVTGMCLSLGTMVGAFLVSYARARAEGLGSGCKVGLMERPERIVLLAIAAITGWVEPVMIILFILTHFTALQRIYHVRKSLK